MRLMQRLIRYDSGCGRASAACGCLLAVLAIVFFSHTAAGDDQRAAAAGATVIREIRYREGASRMWTLDLAVPRAPGTKLRPAIVVIHGGGWIEGDKSSFSTEEQRRPGNIIDFAALGFVVATINYRMSGESPYPAALDDCRCAVRWMRAHADEYRIDPHRIGAYGNSAGGHLALLLAMAPNQPDDALTDTPWREQSSSIQAAVSDSGPVDLVAQYEQGVLRTVVSKFLGGPLDKARAENYKLASPASFVSKDTPPLFLMYGAADEQVPVETADRFVMALSQAVHKDVSYHRLAGVGHCPHSLVGVSWLQPAVNEFFLRVLSSGGGQEEGNVK